MNNLDPDVAEAPGSRRLRRDGRAALVARLPRHRALAPLARRRRDAPRPVGEAGRDPEDVSKAPRVLLANSLLVPRWANWETFRELEAQGLTMYGQMTAAPDLHRHAGNPPGDLRDVRRGRAAALRGIAARTLDAHAGLGGMGGAQPLAVTMNEGICLAVEVDPERVERRLATRYLDRATARRTRRSAGWRRRSAPRARCRSGWWGTRPTLPRSLRGARPRPRDRLPDVGARRAERLRTPVCRSRTRSVCARSAPRNTSRARSNRWGGTCRPCARSRTRAP